MKINKRYKIIVCFFIILFSCSILAFSYKNSEATLEDRKQIISFDLSKDENLIALNNYLCWEDILNYFTIRQKLLSMPYEELIILRERTMKLDSAKELNSLIDKILSKMEEENIFLLKEDIFIDNVPVLTDSPFYKGSVQSFKITDLKAHAEYVYFYNLKLKYKKNTLLKKTETLWINPKEKTGQEEKNRATPRINSSSYNLLVNEANQMWSYNLKDDNLTDFFFDDLRQWIKRYEESAISPIIYKDTIIMRNEHRLFCTELLSSKEIWSFGDMNKSGREFYQTFRHPHHNPYGYELLLANDVIFTELSGRLVAVTLKDILNPQLLWARDLGEYSVCTKPIQNKEILIVGLINARGEFWICGFDCKLGSLVWNTYIGMSSFLSPVCVTSAIWGDRAFIGTNHGVLVCLNATDGEIIWLKKYIPKNYSLFEYWQRGYYKGAFLDVGSIKYDTQFIEIGDDRSLYYKPRESDYLYILDSEDGQIKEEILIDSDKYYILRAYDGRGIFLKKTTGILENSELKIVELASGKLTYNLVIEGGPLQGINYINRDEILFKVDDNVHFLKVDHNEVIHTEVYVPVSGWLLNAEDRFLFIGKDRLLFCLDSFNRKYAYPKNNSYLIEFLEQREKIKNALAEVFQLDAESEQATKMRRQLLSNISIFRFSFDQISPIIVDNLERLRHPAWNEFVSEIQKLYGDEVITYQDIEMKFNNFLYAAALIKSYSIKSERHLIREKNHRGIQKSFQVKGEKLFLLPVEVIKGPKFLDFFLLLNNDQLLCVHEAGDIIWSRKVFYYPAVYRNVAFNTDRTRGRIYADDIEAYLYDNILIINDRVNIIAVDVNNGTYIWSMTNKGRAFTKEKQFPPINQDEILRRFGIQLSFVRNIMFNAEFIDDRIITTHGNKIYSIDPKIGFCKQYRKLDIERIRDITASDGYIYLWTFLPDTLKILDKELTTLGESSLDFVMEKGYPKLFLINNYIMLHVKAPSVSVLYVLDKKNATVKNKINLAGNFISVDNLGRHYLEVFKDNLLFIVPFQKLLNYHFDNDSFIANQIFNVQPIDQDVMWIGVGKKSEYYFIVGEQLLLPLKKEGEYFIASIDLRTGERLWERRLDKVNGFFYNLSNCKNINGTINFIISTTSSAGCGEIYKDGINLCRKLLNIHIQSKLFSLNLRNGRIKRIEELPSMQDGYFRKTALAETKNYLIYNIYGKLTKVERK